MGTVTGVRRAASLYAITKSVLAPCVTESPMWLVPCKVTDPNPVSEVVGKVPTSPVIVVGPVLVIPEPAKTEKLAAVPRSTVVGLTAETKLLAIALQRI